MMEVKDLKRLMDAMAAADVTELELEWDGSEGAPGGRVGLRRETQRTREAQTFAPEPAGSASMTAVAPAAAAAAEPAAPPPAPASTSPRGVEVIAPIVGTFYAAPAPDTADFVKVGDRVTVGQVLCIIEAMKLMNEIEAEVAGTVVEVLVRNEDPVEYGQALFRIAPA